MDILERIIAYTGDETSDAQEQELFAQLASDSGLRQSFKRQLKLNKAASIGAVEKRPSAAVTSTLFTQLGLQYSGASAGAAAASTAAPVASGLSSISSFWSALAVSAIALVGSFTLFDSFLGHDFQNEYQASISERTEATAQSSPITENKNIIEPTSNNESDEELALMKKNFEAIEYRLKDANNKNQLLTKENSYLKSLVDSQELIVKSQENSKEYDNNVKSYPAVNKIIVSPNNALWSNSNLSLKNNSPNNSNGFEEIPAQFGDDIYSDLKKDEDKAIFTKAGVEYRNYNYWNVGEVNLSPKDPPSFNNEGISLFARFFGNTDLIIDARRENFSLKFTGTEDNRLFSYETLPNLETYSIGLRHEPFTFGKMAFYGQGMFGVNAAGEVYRLGGGLTFNPFENFSMILGFEHSLLNFEHQNNGFTSQKNGLFYGLQLSL
ncbi:MAG: hypothetical protein Kapaf2KO_17710 [Candidatus Kapaibacteriales bacterium]